MKKAIIMIIVLVVFVGSAGIGISKKGTYQDIRKTKNYLDSFYVAVKPLGHDEKDVQELQDGLEEVPVIVKVKAIGEIQYYEGTGGQKVEVLKSYQGENLKEGMEIFVCSENWTLYLDTPWQLGISRGYVNFMDIGKEYLLLMEEEKKGKLPYWLYPFDCGITPMFCYQDKENKAIPLDPKVEHTGVLYPLVKEHEFFCETKEGQKKWKELKELLFEKYP